MMKFLRILSLFLLCLFMAGHAPAQQGEPDQYVKIRILPERSAVQADDEIWVGIEQSIYPEWHTYWTNPGDSGAVMRVQWDLPEGFYMSDLEWPVPEKIPYGPLMNFGYHDHVIVLQRLRTPKEIPDGPVTLKAKIEILVCKDICIPEFGDYELKLNDPANPGEDNSAYLLSAQQALPVPVPWNASYRVDDENTVFTVEAEDTSYFEAIDQNSLEFFPIDWGLVSNTAKPEIKINGAALTITQRSGEREASELPEMQGVLAFQNSEGQKQAIQFTAMRSEAAAGPVSKTTQTGIVTALFFALLGGLILNLMPCVFPVLSIKALALVKTAQKEPGHARLSGIFYTAGVVFSFLVIAVALITFKSAGASIGWGFQLQNPLVVSLLAYLLFIIGLNLTGIFEIRGHFGGLGDKLTKGNGLMSSFFTGVLATLVATPCTAPFMALALGYALVQPAPIALAVFTALGLGLALPYLVLCLVPALQKRLPKPGAWMNTFRQFLAFPVFATSIWLVWVLSHQIDSIGVFKIMMGLIGLAFGFWLLNHSPSKKHWRRFVQILAALSFLAAIGFLPCNKAQNPVPGTAKLSFGENYSPEKLAESLLTDDPVFVEMTAAWCITCKVNHAAAIDIDSTRKLFSERNIHYLVGDWTNYDKNITEFLNSYGRNGVPIYVYYGPRDIVTGERPEAELLPQILTPSIVEEAVKRF